MFFGVVLQHRTAVSELKSGDFFFLILTFDPKYGFCKGYSVCMMADFQNGHISRVFSVCWRVLLHRTTVNDL